MDRPAGIIYRILVWSYDRGTLPYDLICILILAFVFLAPRSCFHKEAHGAAGVETAPPGAAASQGSR